MRFTAQIIGFIGLLLILSSFKSSIKNDVRNTHFNVIQKDSVFTDSIKIDSSLINYIPYIEKAHASY